MQEQVRERVRERERGRTKWNKNDDGQSAERGVSGPENDRTRESDGGRQWSCLRREGFRVLKLISRKIFG